VTSGGIGDDELFAALSEAVHAAEDVPREFVAAARAAYTWLSVDAELAALSFDSAMDEQRTPAGTRSSSARLRALTFVSPTLAIELEVGPESLLGQLVPAQPGHIDVEFVDGDTTTVRVDDIGFFVVRPVPAVRFRLRCRTADGADVVTGWVVP
jgi:hypothetical protein